MDDLLNAIVKAGRELMHEHAWDCSDEGTGMEADVTPEGIFAQTIAKHVAPMMDVEGWKKAKVAALRAEIASLESA